MRQQLKRKKKRSLLAKRKKRRKKVRPKMFFLTAFSGDPTRHYRCAMRRYRHHYDLISGWKGYTENRPFIRLKRYQSKKVASITSDGLVLIEKAV